MEDILSGFTGTGGGLFGYPIELVGLAMLMPVLLAMLAFNMLQSRAEVRRRAEAPPAGTEARNRRNPQESNVGQRSLASVVSYVESNVLKGGGADTKVLRKRLIQAGFYAPSAVAIFFLCRLTGAVAGGVLGFLFVPTVMGETTGPTLALYTMVAAIVGWMAPSFILDKLIEGRKTRNRRGFPDFMDLLVVCAEAGLSLEAAIERVSREIAHSHPSLGENLAMVALEIRAGRPMLDALQRLGDRLGLEEAQTLATLLQQSSELGTSLTQSLKIYSDDMRNKRMSRAEEKAYALPAKLVVPLTLFVFPVLLATLLFPVAIKLSSGLGT